MSAQKLDQSLDDILKTRRTSTRRGRGPRRSDAGRPAASAGPVGGVQKSKQTKQSKPATAAPAAPAGGETKIMISNLPQDVEENQLKDYFVTAVGVGRPKKVLMQYGPTGRSLGSATVIFSKHDQAQKAATALDKVKIDGRPIRVEMLVSAANAPAPAAGPSLADRVTQPKKDKPKPATATKAAPAAAGRGRGRGRDARGGRGRGRGGRERATKKTVEELDAEMADYFPNPEGGNDVMVTNGAEAVTATGAVGDTNMDDEPL